MHILGKLVVEFQLKIFHKGKEAESAVKTKTFPQTRASAHEQILLTCTKRNLN